MKWNYMIQNLKYRPGKESLVPVLTDEVYKLTYNQYKSTFRSVRIDANFRSKFSNNISEYSICLNITSHFQ